MGCPCLYRLYLSIVESEKFSSFAFCSWVNAGLIVSTSLTFNFEVCFDSRGLEIEPIFPHLETESEAKVKDNYKK